MGCACGNKNRQTFEVVTNGGSGRVVFSSTSKPTATTVSGRYAGSVVRDKATGDVVHTNEATEETAAK
ncbi:hypothetical protein [Streptomyces sp. NPDC058891]|uniref:hypothetical protein n=1 Tax=Streptomyces sp. NPDC058891 TaxID=3346667 RepID=UPI0036910CEA